MFTFGGCRYGLTEEPVAEAIARQHHELVGRAREELVHRDRSRFVWNDSKRLPLVGTAASHRRAVLHDHVPGRYTRAGYKEGIGGRNQLIEATSGMETIILRDGTIDTKRGETTNGTQI